MKKEEIIKKLNSYNLQFEERLLVVENNSIIYHGSLDWSNKSLCEIPVEFDLITGNFNLSSNKISSIKNFPKRVNHTFDISQNLLKTVKLKNLECDTLFLENNEIEIFEILEDVKIQSLLNLCCNYLLYFDSEKTGNIRYNLSSNFLYWTNLKESEKVIGSNRNLKYLKLSRESYDNFISKTTDLKLIKKFKEDCFEFNLIEISELEESLFTMKRDSGIDLI